MPIRNDEPASLMDASETRLDHYSPPSPRQSSQIRFRPSLPATATSNVRHRGAPACAASHGVPRRTQTHSASLHLRCEFAKELRIVSPDSPPATTKSNFGRRDAPACAASYGVPRRTQTHSASFHLRCELANELCIVSPDSQANIKKRWFLESGHDELPS